MKRSLRFAALSCAVACAGGSTRPGTPAPAPTTSAQPSSRAPLVQLGPAMMRYLVRQDVHIEQNFAGLPPTMHLGYGLYLTAIVSGPADSLGYRATFTIDSVTIDSGSQIPPQLNLAGARGFRVTGRLSPSGEFTNPVPSDTNTAASLGNLLPRFRSFFPRLPAGGVRPDTTWSDSTTTTESSGGASITTHVQSSRTATVWVERSGVRALRIEVAANYQFSGTGEQSGSAFTIDGTGMGGGIQYLAGDGRYLGGEAHDSTTMTIDLPIQGFTIPRRQTANTTVTALLP